MYTQGAVAGSDNEIYTVGVERGVDDLPGCTPVTLPELRDFLRVVVVSETLFEVTLFRVCFIRRLDVVKFPLKAVELTFGHGPIAILSIKFDNVFGTADGTFIEGVNEATYANIFELPDYVGSDLAGAQGMIDAAMLTCDAHSGAFSVHGWFIEVCNLDGVLQ